MTKAAGLRRVHVQMNPNQWILKGNQPYWTAIVTAAMVLLIGDLQYSKFCTESLLKEHKAESENLLCSAGYYSSRPSSEIVAFEW